MKFKSFNTLTPLSLGFPFMSTLTHRLYNDPFKSYFSSRDNGVSKMFDIATNRKGSSSPIWTCVFACWCNCLR